MVWGCVLVFMACGESNEEAVSIESADVEDNNVQSILAFDVPTPDAVWELDTVSDGSDGGEEADVEVVPLFSCSESIGTPLSEGAGLLYTCLSTAEGLPYQEIRQLEAESGEIRSVVTIELPERLGTSLKARDGYVYFDTALMNGDTVASRSIYRLELSEGAERELVRELGVDDFSEVGWDDSFSASNQVLNLLLQPKGTRIAFHLADQVSQMGQGGMYVFEPNDGALEAFIPPEGGAVRRAAWSQDGMQILMTAGGTLTVAGADLSGAKFLDNAVMTTGATPQELSKGVIVYAGKKNEIRKLVENEAGDFDKLDIGTPFSKEISRIYRVSSTEFLVVAGSVYLMNFTTEEVTDLGNLPGQGLTHPLAVSPSGNGYVAGGSIDNPFRSFEYYTHIFESDLNEFVVGTEKGAGYVSNAVIWY